MAAPSRVTPPAITVATTHSSRVLLDIDRPGAPKSLARQPFGNPPEGIVPRSGIGADMHAADASGRDRHAAALLQRQVRVVEVMIRAGIDHDRGPYAAPACARDHLLARVRGRPVVLRADQHQGRHARAPGSVAQAAATRIEHGGGAEIRLAVLYTAQTHNPERNDASIS